MQFLRCASGSTTGPEMTEADVAISVRHLSKQFRIPHQKNRTMFERIQQRVLHRESLYETFNALNDLSFVIRKGETVGVIGPNGSGKSTLLKLLAGVLYPTRGCVLVNGRVAPFLELGVGFEVELTARENVYLYGSIMGMSRREIDRKYWDIMNFSELRRFENMKIRNFSSGMHLRLGFSIAIHTNPEILLVDEVLAVGDESFQQKCMEKIEEIRREGVTILFVSHDLVQIRAICRTCMLFHHGQVTAKGTPEEVIDHYHWAIAEAAAAAEKAAPDFRRSVKQQERL